jgi:stage II sporulation protein AA (anti-sigma F factor antagonist)
MSQAATVKTKKIGEVVVIEIEGDLDVSSLPVVYAAMQKAREAGDVKMVLDLSGTKYVTSTAVGLVVKSWKDLKDKGGDLTLCGVSPFIKKTLAMLGVEKIIGMYGSQQEAADGCQ